MTSDPLAPQHVIGVMSGTSCDGVDAVLLDLHSPERPHAPAILQRSSVAFPPDLQRQLLQPEVLRSPRICELHFELASYYVRAVKALPDYPSAKVIGIHGQTLWHQTDPRAKVRSSLQIGSSAVVAAQTGIATVGDMRAADVALGGLGAPIAPLAHWFFWAEQGTPALVVNLGGMANLTYVTQKSQDVLAYDIGPGMVLSDAFAQVHTNQNQMHDRDGHLSQGGKLIAPLITDILAHPYIRRAPPKSTGREEFNANYAQSLWQRYSANHSAADLSYTFAAAPMHILQQTLRQDQRLQGALQAIVLTGGGALNPTLVGVAQQLFAPTPVQVRLDGVFAPQNHEPAAMALIAARTMARLPSSLAQVTGARASAVLGHVSLPPLPGI